jgi:uncharacterized protein with HEPN domain
MSPSPSDVLRHMLNEANFLLMHGASTVLDDFLQDDVLQRAFVRSIEIIGEAAGKLPEDLKQKHGGIDWRALSAMRNRLIHGYFGVDYEIVWDVITRKIPELRDELSMMLHEVQEVQSETSPD